MFPVRDGLVPSFLSPPSNIHPGSLLCNILPVSSIFSSYLPPLCPFLSIQPTPSSVYSPHCPSPIVRPSESYQPSGFGRPMSSPGFLPERPICRFAPPPPPTCAAGGTWLGCGWRGKGDGTPRDGLESLDSSADVVCCRRRSYSLLILALPVSLSAPPRPPPPFPVQMYLSLYSQS